MGLVMRGQCVTHSGDGACDESQCVTHSGDGAGDEGQCVTHRGDGTGDESLLHTEVMGLVMRVCYTQWLMGLVVRVSVPTLKIPSTGSYTIVLDTGKCCKHQ